jgi:hypothetical protein
MRFHTPVLTLTAFSTLLGASTTAQEQVYLLGAEATNASDFGRAVADAGDVDLDGVPDVVVGAPFDSGNGAGAGRVFVYSGRTGDLLWERGGEFPGDAFGWSVDGLGDINGDGRSDVIVGAPLWDNNDLWDGGSGAVYVLSGTGAGTIFEVRINALNASMGYAVRGFGDVSGDGVGDFAFSIPNRDWNGFTDNGYVAVYSGATTLLLFSSSGVENGASFGYSLDVVRATGAQATSRLIMGEPRVDGGGVDRGRARLMDGFGNTVSLFTGATDNEWLGASVAGLGDVDADGWEDYAFGSPYADIVSVGADAGLVKVYSGASTSFLFSITGATAGANLGQSLAGIGDFNDDGKDDVLVGAPNDDSVFSDGGEARLVSGAGGGTLHSWSGGVNDHMGRAVSSAGDLNLDGHRDIVIGANDAPFGAGEAYVRLAVAAAPTTYCTAKVNSQGCTPQVGSEGVASLSIADDFHVTAENVINNKFGILFWGRGPRNTPFLGGTLCVDSPLKRTAPQNSGGNSGGVDCSGTYSFHFSHAYMTAKGVTAGDRIHAQFWSRDPAASFGVGLTDAVAFAVLP